jgi:hypothetical protein
MKSFIKKTLQNIQRKEGKKKEIMGPGQRGEGNSEKQDKKEDQWKLKTERIREWKGEGERRKSGKEYGG